MNKNILTKNYPSTKTCRISNNYKVCGKLENLLSSKMYILYNIKNAINSCSDIDYDLKEESDFIESFVPGYKNKEAGTVSLGYGCVKKYTLYKE